MKEKKITITLKEDESNLGNIYVKHDKEIGIIEAVGILKIAIGVLIKKIIP